MKIDKDLMKMNAAQKIMRLDTRKTYERLASFLKKVLGREEDIYVERDITLCDTRSKGYLFYPESIKKIILTKPLTRMARIFQLGTKIYEKPDVCHTRLEHCKGTFYRTLEVLENLLKDQDVERLMKNEKFRRCISVSLVRGLLHDIGHGPFSHAMETICNLPKGFHEEMGIRMIRENKELRDALNEFYPGLTDIYEETIEEDALGLNRIFEGQVDLDRGDFLPRDSFFANKKFNYISSNVSQLFKHMKLEIFTDKDGKKIVAPVFDADQIDNLDNFFINRYNNYRKFYITPESRSYDNIYKAFAQELLKSDESYRLKDFLKHNMNKKPEDVDLDEYIEFNDVEYIKGIIEVIDKTQNPTLKKLAVMSLPPKDRIDDIYFGLMVSVEQVNELGERKDLVDTDTEFVKRLYDLVDSREEYDRSCLIITNRNKDDIETFVSKVKEELGIDDQELENMGVYRWDPQVVSYKNKKSEETYVKGKDGKIYEYSVHPDRKAPILKENVPGCCVLLPILEARGVSEEKINKIKEIYEKKFKDKEQKLIAG